VKWGSGLAIRLPKALIKQTHLQEGDFVQIEVLGGHIDLTPGERIPPLEKLVAQITPENRHGETDWGPARGKEIVGW
jgi:antitoxin MazE